MFVQCYLYLLPQGENSKALHSFHIVSLRQEYVTQKRETPLNVCLYYLTVVCLPWDGNWIFKYNSGYCSCNGSQTDKACEPSNKLMLLLPCLPPFIYTSAVPYVSPSLLFNKNNDCIGHFGCSSSIPVHNIWHLCGQNGNEIGFSNNT